MLKSGAKLRNPELYHECLRLSIPGLPPKRLTVEEAREQVKLMGMGFSPKVAERMAAADQMAANRKAAAQRSPLPQPAQRGGAGDPNAPFRGMHRTEYEAWRRANPNWFKHGSMDPPKPAPQEGKLSYVEFEFPADAPDIAEFKVWLKEADDGELMFFIGRASASFSSSKLAGFLLDDPLTAYKAFKNYKAADVVIVRRPSKAVAVQPKAAAAA